MKNKLSFSTRRNKNINLTEYYNLAYQYENDCLSASIEYNREFYKDRDIKPNNSLFLNYQLFQLAVTVIQIYQIKMVSFNLKLILFVLFIFSKYQI